MFSKSGSPYLFSSLSSGEQEAFDLLLDLQLWHHEFSDAVYVIDEPDLHLHSASQGELLEQLLDFIVGPNQLWIATHSIGIIKVAFDLERREPGCVSILDFTSVDRGSATRVLHQRISRDLWKKALSVSLYDMAGLVCALVVIICEGTPISPWRNPSLSAVTVIAVRVAVEPRTFDLKRRNSLMILETASKTFPY